MRTAAIATVDLIAFLTGIILVGLIVLQVTAKPVPPPAPAKEKAPAKKEVPNISWLSDYGMISQIGKDVTIGDATTTWEADGYFRDDGKIVLHWIYRQRGWAATGLYWINENGLGGVWDDGDIGFADDGSLIGPSVRTDQIWRLYQPKRK